VLRQLSQLGEVTRPVFGIPTELIGKRPNTLPRPCFGKQKGKNALVMKALGQNRWISHICPIQSIEELQEFIALWEGVTTVNMIEDSEDEIRWKWTPDGQYTTQSAYRLQFFGTTQETGPYPDLESTRGA
jgi:hypothetical protein